MEHKPDWPKDRVLLEIKTARTEEVTPEGMVQFLASLTNLRKRLLYVIPRGVPISLEMAVIDQMVHFFVAVPPEYKTFIESQLISQYPKALLTASKDYLPDLFANGSVSLGQMKLTTNYFYPLRVFSEYKDVDPLSSLLGVLSKAQIGDRVAIQYMLVPVSTSWQASGYRVANKKYSDVSGTEKPNPYASVITTKIAANGFKVGIRLAVSAPTKERSWSFLMEIANSYSSMNNPSGNSLIFRRLFLWQQDRLKSSMLSRSRYFVPQQILNVQEIATLYHFPTIKLATIQNISWFRTILSEPPDNLPVAENLTDEQKGGINFFAKTVFKNRQMTFGIKKIDRRRHFYCIGKSGTGKSTFIANMAISDMRNGHGFCVIDPHGDLCEQILHYVPSYRVNDIIYMDPSDLTRAFALNPLEVNNEEQKELVASGIVAIFKKLYGTSWGPRLEYILRNSVVSVMDMPDATLLMIPELLTNPNFRQKVIDKIQDPILKSFWLNEFNNMQERLRTEAISPITNKVGQFVSSKRIRNIIGHPKSTVDIEKVMNEGKILILNLSQGYLGEDNAALLGAMIITKIQLAAMNRISIAEEDRRDFYLYVDEFQNFATSSFIKILSEARKFRLSLILANQYMAQIPDDIRAAIFGNAGTLMSFLIGADDAGYMAKEFSERFKEEDLLALGNYQAILKLCIDSRTQAPFHCYTLPLPNSVTQNREKVLKVSRERYTKPVGALQAEEMFVAGNIVAAAAPRPAGSGPKQWGNKPKAPAHADGHKPQSLGSPAQPHQQPQHGSGSVQPQNKPHQEQKRSN